LSSEVMELEGSSVLWLDDGADMIIACAEAGNQLCIFLT
jgi:hypothetical protein